MDNYELILQKLYTKLYEIDAQICASKKILTAEEAASFLNLEKAYLYKLTSAGIIPFSKPNGKKIYFSRADLETWALSNRSSSLQEKEAAASTYLATKKK